MTRLALVVLLLAAPVAAGSGAHGWAAPEVVLSGTLAVPFDIAPTPELAMLVYDAAIAAGVPPRILAALLREESGFDPLAFNVNEDGSRDLGIAQLGEVWMADFIYFDNGGIVFDPFNPSEAIPVAARYLARLHLAIGTWPGAVAAYNCGLARVRGGRIPARTRRYVAAIFETNGDGGAR